MIILSLLCTVVAACIVFAVVLIRRSEPFIAAYVIFLACVASMLGMFGGPALQRAVSDPVDLAGSTAEQLLEVDDTYLTASVTAEGDVVYLYFAEGPNGQAEEHVAQDVTVTFSDQSRVTATEVVRPGGLFWPWDVPDGTRYDFEVPEDGVTR